MKSIHYESLGLSEKALSLINSSASLRKIVDSFILENSNVNPIEEEILVAEKHIVASIEVMVEAFRANKISGPYDLEHFELIKSLLLYADIINCDHSEFWNYFSFECAGVNQEIKRGASELIYMQAIINILNIHDSFAYIDKKDVLSVYDLNTNKLGFLKSKGIHSKF